MMFLNQTHDRTPKTAVSGDTQQMLAVGLMLFPVRETIWFNVACLAHDSVYISNCAASLPHTEVVWIELGS